jgi:hypothetical protein
MEGVRAEALGQDWIGRAAATLCNQMRIQQGLICPMHL